MADVKLSRKNQIVVPKEAREALGVEPGDELIVTVRGKRAIVMRKPASYAEALKGVAKGVYPSGYLKSERSRWD
jgi:AbrB family looped-hinge helix DNA binding protein